MGSIQSRQIAMNYQRPGQRPSCANCVHRKTDYADRMPPFEDRTHRCKTGGFVVSLGAICAEHQKRAATPGSAP